MRDFPGSPVVKIAPCNTGDAGLIPGQGTKISHVVGQLSLSATTREEKSMCCNKDPAQPKQILGREGDMAGMQWRMDFLTGDREGSVLFTTVSPAFNTWQTLNKYEKWRKWMSTWMASELQPCTPVLLPGKSQGWRSLVGFNLWDSTESDTTEAT